MPPRTGLRAVVVSAVLCLATICWWQRPGAHLNVVSAPRQLGAGADGPSAPGSRDQVQRMVQRLVKSEYTASSLAARHPLNRLQCGSGWQERYAKLHADILGGRAPQRYTVFRSLNEFENGLADRLATSVTIFFTALISDRAFQYDYEGDTGLWEALRSDFIDWRYTRPDVGNDTLSLDYLDHADGPVDLQDRIQPAYRDLFVSSNTSAIGEGRHSVVWLSDHAALWHAYDNPLLQPLLTAWGLPRENAFACLFDFLYRPTDDVIKALGPQLGVMLDPDVLKIGVQIRVGDWQLCDSYMFKPQSYPSVFRHFFDCAKQLERQLAKPGQQVVWYLLADINSLRDALSERYPTRILVNTEGQVEHSVKGPSHSRDGFMFAAAELWSFSLMQYHIISKKSGFGKVGAMVSGNRQNIFTIDYPMNFFNLLALDNRKVISLYNGRQCTTNHADSIRDVCTTFTGC